MYMYMYMYMYKVTPTCWIIFWAVQIWREIVRRSLIALSNSSVSLCLCLCLFKHIFKPTAYSMQDRREPSRNKTKMKPAMKLSPAPIVSWNMKIATWRLLFYASMLSCFEKLFMPFMNRPWKPVTDLLLLLGRTHCKYHVKSIYNVSVFTIFFFFFNRTNSEILRKSWNPS